MQFTVQVEKTSPIARKLTVKVPATEVAKRFESGLAEVQKTANLKGFRPGQAPITIIRQYYGEDVRHRVFHNVIDESFREAVREQKLRAVGSPKIETPEHQHGAGDHDHGIKEGQDLTYTATVEVLPELEVKGYTGIALTREGVEVKDADVDAIVNNILDSQAELVPAASGLADASGKASSRPARKGDYADIAFSGGLVTDSGIKELAGMKGSRMIEIGGNSLIPGFEDNLIDMRAGDSKTFRITFPADYHEKELAGKESEFSVTINELKEKKVPELNDDYAKQMGYENVGDLRKKAHEHLLKERTGEVDRKLRSELVDAIIEKNPFDVPAALIESQTRALAQDWAQELKRQGIPDQTIQQAIMGELANLRKRAESQVRASLVLESIAEKEKIAVDATKFDEELESAAKSMNVEAEKLRDYYAKNPGSREDFEFRLRQEATIKFLLEKAKIKSKS